MPVSAPQPIIVSAEDARTPELLAMRLNQIFSAIVDRLDKIEGLRGDAEIQGNLKILDAAGHHIAGFSRT